MNNYAIVKKGNHQYFLEEGEILEIPHIDAEEGKDYTFDHVLAIGTDSEFYLGMPYVEGAKVVVFVIKHVKGEKKYGFKYKAKSRYRKKWGYRNLFTRIRVKEIILPKKTSRKENAQSKSAKESNQSTKKTKDTKSSANREEKKVKEAKSKKIAS